MAKYELSDDPEFRNDHAVEDYGTTPFYLRAIANELAEANRLKRLELQKKRDKDWEHDSRMDYA